MRIDDIQIEAVARNHMWATIARDGPAFVLTDYRHPGELRLEWDGDILWLSHSSGKQVGLSSTLPQAPILDSYLPAYLEHFANGGAEPLFPEGVVVLAGEDLPPEGSTVREQVIAARVGQGLYRDQLLAKWDGACAVTGLAEPEFLMASHAKPWRVASNAERLDGDNGLPLIPDLDKLFDKGFISFSDDGMIVLSPSLSQSAQKAMGVDASLHLLKPLNNAQKSYLAFHRQHVFKLNNKKTIGEVL